MRYIVLLIHQSVRATESAVVWGEVSEAIVNKDWEKAREAKNSVEERQRRLRIERESKGQNWTPKHFTLSHTKEGGWECSPLHNWVPSAPLTAL